MALPDPQRVLRPRLYVTPSDLQCGRGLPGTGQEVGGPSAFVK